MVGGDRFPRWCPTLMQQARRSWHCGNRKSQPLPTSDQRGVRYLVRSQMEDGSWLVRTRSPSFQPYFESDFPHGYDQFISAAASNWAVMALLPAMVPLRNW